MIIYLAVQNQKQMNALSINAKYYSYYRIWRGRSGCTTSPYALGISCGVHAATGMPYLVYAELDNTQCPCQPLRAYWLFFYASLLNKHCSHGQTGGCVQFLGVSEGNIKIPHWTTRPILKKHKSSGWVAVWSCFDVPYWRQWPQRRRHDGCCSIHQHPNRPMLPEHYLVWSPLVCHGNKPWPKLNKP